MRVVMVVPTFPRRSETFIVSKLVGLVGRGLDVHLVCGQLDPDLVPDFPRLDGVLDRVHAVASGPGRVPRARGTVVGTAATVAARRWATARAINGRRSEARLGWWGEDSWLARLAPDIVHAEFGTVGRDHAASAGAAGAALTVSFRGYDLAFAGLDRPDYYEPVWRHAAAVHVLGQDLLARARARGCPPDMPWRAISPAVDLDALGPAPERRSGALGTEGAPLRLVTVGRVEWKKGHEYGLRAVRDLVARGLRVRWRVVGGGDQLEAVAFGVHDLGLTDSVELVGPCPAAEVAAHLRWADVLLHPAVSEGFGNAVLEAQASALAAVVTDADGLPENVEPEVTGLVVGRRDPSALADAVAALAADGDRRVAMGRAGRRRVEERFGLPDHLDRWESFYADVHAGRRGR